MRRDTQRRRTGVVARLAVAVGLAAAAVTGGPVSGAGASGGLTTLTGTLPDGATYLIEVPAGWNGDVLLYSHGYVVPGSSNPARDVGDPVTRAWLLANGYALAGSSYATTGWAIHEALPDQIATLDIFDSQVGQPAHTYAWGHSLGGIITAGLVQRYPDRFTAALPMCGVLAGGVGTWNQALDSAYALQTLLAPSVQIVHITNPLLNLGMAEAAIVAAQATPQGRARLALGSALADVPGWFTPTSPEPAATDFAAQEANQFIWQTQVDAPFAFAFRADLEARAGGNPSWNAGVNYGQQLEKSVDYNEVVALYGAAGLDLNADIATLNAGTRVSADSGAVDYLVQNIVFDGNLSGLPVLTMHTTGDGLVVNEDEQAYRAAVIGAKDSQLLRETFVHRAGHCAFTPAETITAFETLVQRVETGKWTGSTDPATMDAEAAALGPAFNIFSVGGAVVPAGPDFISFEPAPFLRPFDLG